MPLQSILFKGDQALEACLARDEAHVTLGTVGDHVTKIQVALQDLDGASIAQAELDAKRYGPSTAAAVLAYKQKRKIINISYQSKADNIVGKMTIAALDKEMFDKQTPSRPQLRSYCRRVGASVPLEQRGNFRRSSWSTAPSSPP